MQKWIILGVVFVIIVIGAVLVFNTNIETEYIPEKEIDDIDLRKTIVTLYFQDKETKSLQKESRMIDSKNLLQNPYKKLITMLIEGPQSENLESVIPNTAKILNVLVEANCAVIDFSKEFVENASTDEKTKYNSVYSIVHTLAELTEVTSIKILIEGEEVDGFVEIGINLKEKLVKIPVEEIVGVEKEEEVN